MTHTSRSARSRLFLLTLGLLSFLLVAGDALAQSWAGKGRLRGTVKAEDGKPLEGAQILIFLDTQGNGPDPLYTDKKGRWEFLGLTSGDFTVQVTAEGYIPSEGVVGVTESGSNRTPPIITSLRSLKELQDQATARVQGLADQANAKMEAGDWAGAREILNGVKEAMSEDAQIRRVDAQIAETYLREGKPQEARTRFEALVGRSADDPAQQVNYLQRIALTHYEEQDIDTAVATLDKALVLQPENVGSLRMAIDFLVGANREPEAEPYMNRLPAGEKVDANALLNVGIAAYNDGDVDTALEKFERVLGDYPENPNAHYYLGLCYLGKGVNDKARMHLEKLLEIAPDHERAEEAKEFLTYL